MKTEIHKTPETEILKSYPIKGKTSGWYYRTTETSNNAWLIEGSDLWGRKISIQGSDLDALIIEAEKQTLEIKNETKNT